MPPPPAPALDETRVVAVDDQAATRFVADSLACSPKAWAWWLERGSREDLSGLVSRVAVPVLVLVEDGDPVIPRAVVDASLFGRLPDAAFTLVPEAGHRLPPEVPAACAEASRAFALSCGLARPS